MGDQARLVLRQALILLFMFPFAAANGQQIAADNELEGEAEGAEIEEVIVTGSRIVRTGFETSTPVAVFDSEFLAETGETNLADVFRKIPAIGVGLGPDSSVFAPDPGATFVNLRNLGIERTLVLIDGRRRVSGTKFSGAVDVSTIPVSMIERLEVMTGGGSAVYGADAVTGVINIILKKDFEGVEVSGTAGWSDDGGADSEQVSLLAGTPFAADQGRFTFGASYNQQDPLFPLERDWSQEPNGYMLFGADPDSSSFMTTLDNYRFTDTAEGGTFYAINPDFTGCARYTVDPNLRVTQNDYYPFDDPFAGPQCASWIASGGDGFSESVYGQLRSEIEMTTAMTAVEYDFSDTLTGFFNFDLASGESFTVGQPTFDYSTVVLRSNPLLPADVAALMDAQEFFLGGALFVSGTHANLGPVSTRNERDTYTAALGLRGEIGDYSWDASYQYGEFEIDTTIVNDRREERYFAAIDVIADPVTGAPVCRDAAMRAAGCVPISVFGRQAPSPEALAFISNQTPYQTESTQDLLDLNLTGDLFDMPAGPLQFAAGFEYRKETIKFRSNELSKSTYTGQGRSFWEPAGAQVNALWSGVVDDAPDADFKVYDYYAEFRLPVLADMAAAQALDLEAAVRYSDYDSTDSTTTWQMAANWAPVESFRIRATRSRNVRAPNLFELYSVQSTVLSNLTDPCDDDAIAGGPNRPANCAALGIPEGWDDPRAGVAKNILLGGNPELESETSDSWTLGGVLDLGVSDGQLRVAVDYWNIDLDDAISETDATTIVNNCVDAPTIDNDFCPLVTRDGSDFSLLTIKSTKINLQNLLAEGIDFELSYYHGAPSLIGASEGGLSIGLNGTYLLANEETAIQDDPNTLDLRDGELGYPEWRLNLRTDYTTGPLSLTWSLRYIDSTVVDSTPPDAPPGFSSFYPAGFNHFGSAMYNDFSARYWFGESFELSAGINNAFDEEPPIAGKFYTAAAAGGFDQIGRYYWLGLKYRY